MTAYLKLFKLQVSLSLESPSVSRCIVVFFVDPPDIPPLFQGFFVANWGPSATCSYVYL